MEIGASAVVLWDLSDFIKERQITAFRLMGVAFICLSTYVGIQRAIVLVTGYHPGHSPVGIGWTAITAVVMFLLAAGKGTGTALDNPVLQTQGRVTFVKGAAYLKGRPGVA